MSTKFLLIAIMFYAISVHCQNFVEVTKSSGGQTINLSNDEVLEIKLHCQPSTGFGWYITEIDTNVIKQNGNTIFIADTNNINNIMIGQAGTVLIRFIVASQGTSVLTLRYMKSA
jgi:predicted secreted protein